LKAGFEGGLESIAEIPLGSVRGMEVIGNLFEGLEANSLS